MALYPAFHAYFRTSQVPLLAAWGARDEIFGPAGATAFLRDLPEAEVHLLPAGHFALETHSTQIAALIDDFLARRLPSWGRFAAGLPIDRSARPPAAR